MSISRASVSILKSPKKSSFIPFFFLISYLLDIMTDFHLFDINEENDIFDIDVTIFQEDETNNDHYPPGLKDRLANFRIFDDYLWPP
jgi:hypothetical protein